jgi:hypothetical protein
MDEVNDIINHYEIDNVELKKKLLDIANHRIAIKKTVKTSI